MPLLPEWLRMLWVAALLGATALHVRHAWLMPGRVRWWHAGHTTMAIGMILMYLLDRMQHPALYQAELAVFASALLTVAAITAAISPRRGCAQPIVVGRHTRPAGHGLHVAASREPQRGANRSDPDLPDLPGVGLVAGVVGPPLGTARSSQCASTQHEAEHGHRCDGDPGSYRQAGGRVAGPGAAGCSVPPARTLPAVHTKHSGQPRGDGRRDGIHACGNVVRPYRSDLPGRFERIGERRKCPIPLQMSQRLACLLGRLR